MARDNAITKLSERAAAAAAGTVTAYQTMGSRPFIFTGFHWMYETAEANADNTLDFAIAYSDAGAAFVDLFANANPNGLLNTSAVLVTNANLGNAAASGGAAVAVTPTEARIPANSVLRFTIVTAGTGTIPAVHVGISGNYV